MLSIQNIILLKGFTEKEYRNDIIFKRKIAAEYIINRNVFNKEYDKKM